MNLKPKKNNFCYKAVKYRTAVPGEQCRMEILAGHHAE